MAAAAASVGHAGALGECVGLRKHGFYHSCAQVSQPGRYNTCIVTTTCKMRSRNPRAYTRKSSEKKMPEKPLSPGNDSESTAAEGSREILEHTTGLIPAGFVPDPIGDSSIADEQTPATAKNGVVNASLEAKEPNGGELEVAEVSSTSQFLGHLGSEEENFIDIVEELMQKAKDAERNILKLNEVRLQNLEQMEKLRREKDKLIGKVNILQVHLAEAEAKLRLASHDKVKTQMLEEQIETLRAKNDMDKTQDERLVALDNKLQKLFQDMQEKDKDLSKAEAKAAQLYKENEVLKNTLKLLQSEIVQEIVAQSSISDLESILEAVKGDKENSKRHSNESTEWLDPMKRGCPQLEDVNELEAALATLENENDLLEQAHAENKVLREKIKMLEERLEQSDMEIRSQLEVYQAEVESFQAALEKLKMEKSFKEAADDMPWEFWSHILLIIDGWLLEKRLPVSDAVTLREMAWRRDYRIKDVFISKKGLEDDEIISALVNLLKGNKRPGMHIIHIAAEMAPVAKVGGLGDVVTGLGKSFQRKGHLVEVVLPKYDCMDYSRISNLKAVNMDLNSHFDGHMFKNRIWLGSVEGLPVYFIEPLHPAKLFWRGQVYGERDDFIRFTYFSRAALEFVLQSNKRPNIIHCHDWHTALVAPLYWDIYAPQGLDCARLAFTCHNFEYQGTENPGALAACGLDPQRMHRPDRMQDNFIQNRINLLKGGIVFSNIVTTVSPTYAQEVQGPEGGKGLHMTLLAHSHKFFGILNGIDTEAWNPASDMLIDHQYSAEDISGKAANKAALRARLSMSASGLDAGKPLIGCITRLVPQKGVHLIRHAIFRTLEQGGQFVLLGSSPIRHIQHEFESIANQFAHHPHVRLILKYDEILSHCIYAAADLFIIPSIFEPCGLTQMIAMRYGAIPIARKTGGLNDSVFDVDDETLPLLTRNGFTFSSPNEEGLNYALDRALKYYMQQHDWWKDLARRTMLMDFSWNISADQYAELYQKAIARSQGNA